MLVVVAIALWSNASGADSSTDSLTVVLPDLIVGAAGAEMADPAQVFLSEVLIESRDPVALEDLGSLLPATWAATNSRGESAFVVRGASERHVRNWLEDIPLAVPWDERVDLSMVPVQAVTGVDATRGVVSALDGIGTLAGAVRLRTGPLYPGQNSTLFSGRAGQVDAYQLGLVHRSGRGAWDLLGSLSWRQRRGLTVPDGYEAEYHQDDQEGSVRTNSDLEQGAILLDGRRPVAGTGQLRLTVGASDGEKGVPPETHLDDDARFWRYPLLRRLLAGASLAMPLDDGADWWLDAVTSYDNYRQDIQSFDDDTYSSPPLVPGTDYESGHDQTGYARARLSRDLGGPTNIALQAESRYTHHNETLVVDGPEYAYSQWLGSLVAEAAALRLGVLRLTAGAGWEVAATPETGDKPARDPEQAGVFNLRLASDALASLSVHGAASRRSRFPSLRELFSGALGRFLPNPDLGPEHQDLVEIGLTGRGKGWDLGLAAYASFLSDGIERVVVPDTTALYTRVNREQIRTLGGEVVGGWRPGHTLSFTGQYAYIDARVKEGDSYDRPAEDRPQYLLTLTGAWSPGLGLGLAAEWRLLGPRYSADPSAADGLTRIGAQGRWSLRAGYTIFPNFRNEGALSSGEIFLRLDNIFDQVVEYQVGLPEPGRTVSVGLQARFGG